MYVYGNSASADIFCSFRATHPRHLQAGKKRIWDESKSTNGQTDQNAVFEKGEASVSGMEEPGHSRPV